MANIIGTATDQSAVNGQLGSLAFQDPNGTALSTTLNQITDTTTTAPAAVFDFSNGQKVDRRFQLSRSSAGTFVGRNGLIQTALYGQPRIDFDPVTGQCKGLLIEETRTNLWTSSADVSSGGAGVYNNWNAATVTTDTAVAPDGTTTADTFFGSSPTATRHVTFSATAGTAYTFSMYVNRNPASNDTNLSQFGVAISWSNNGSSLTGYTTVSVNAHTLPQGVWTRVSTTYTCPTGAVSMQMGPSNCGGGSAGDQLYSIFVWGCQIEAGSFATTLIPTTGSSATRSNEQLVMNQTTLRSFLNPGYNSSMIGSFYASFQPYAVDRSSDFICFTGSSWLRLEANTGSGGYFEINATANPNIAGGAAGFSCATGTGPNAPLTGKVNNYAFGINYTDLNFAVNGVLAFQSGYTSAKPYHPYPTGMYVGSLNNGYQNLWTNGWLRKLSIYSQKLTDAEIIEMTR